VVGVPCRDDWSDDAHSVYRLMGSTPLFLATLCYVLTAVELCLRGDYALAVTFGAYAVANGGLLYIAFY
jgi:hypothetical protein